MDFSKEIFGLMAAFLTTYAFVPQAYKVWKTKEVKDVSLSMYLIMLIGICLWFTYGVFLKSLSILVGNIISFVLVTSIIFFKLKYSKKNK